MMRNTRRPGLVVAVTATVCACALAAAVPNATDTYEYRMGVAHLETTPTSGVPPGTSLSDSPGEDVEPHGIDIYDQVTDLPEYHVKPSDALHEKCFREVRRFCVKATFCGYACEQILLAVQSWCKEIVTVPTTAPSEKCGDGMLKEKGCPKGETEVKWRRCEKARKYNQCFPKICYKKIEIGDVEHDPPNVTVPETHSVRSQISIVRYKKPPPQHEIDAARNRQTSTQSLIFRGARQRNV